jgi:Spy/CpxP family protein refolding chaperone
MLSLTKEASMLGFVFGTVCLVALFSVLRHGRHGRWGYAHGCAHGGCHHGGFGGHWGRGGPWQGHGRWDGGGRGDFGDGFMLRNVFSRLGTTPEQESVIRNAVNKVRETMREARAEWRDTSDLSSLLRGEVFDRTAAEGVSGKADASFAKVRVVLVEALAQIHETLDERQRGILAELIESRGRGFFRGPFGRGRDVSNDERWV